jgi:DNA-binding transcriptional LysR family regulator
MTVANSETIETRVADYSLDVGLIESPSHLPSLHTEICCEDELVMICAPGHKLAQMVAVTPLLILAEPYVSRETGSGTREFADNYFHQHKFSPDDLRIVMELGSPEAIKGVVETGLGVSIMSRATIVKEIKLKTLVAVPLKPRLIRTMSLVYPKEKFQSKLIATFIEFSVSRMKQMADVA